VKAFPATSVLGPVAAAIHANAVVPRLRDPDTGPAPYPASTLRECDATTTAGLKLHSAIYEGWVRHRRYAPRAYAFRYRICMLHLDLDELDHVFAGRWLWSIGRPNIAQFRRSDYLGDPQMPLADAVRERVRQETGRTPAGPIRLLTHLRYFGHCFNPVSFYYCYEPDGVTLDCIVAEITNTPWQERHAYVLPAGSAARHGRAFAWAFRKAFHVSPFLPMDRDYAWRFTTPRASLHAHMDVMRDGRVEVDATLVLERREMSAANLARVLLRFPAMTVRVVAAIHWQALRLWLRRTPVHDHPNRQEH